MSILIIFAFSPERRFKNISPCRRLFEDLSTNQNSPSPNGFVVGNGNLATPNTSFSNNNNNNNNNSNNSNKNNFIIDEDDNNGNRNNIIFGNLNDANAVTKDDKLGAIGTTLTVNNNPSTSTSNNNNFIIEGLTDILYSSYQRRRSLKFDNSSYNSGITKTKSTNFTNLGNCVSSPFMDDLGFLSHSANTSNSSNNFDVVISSGDMKKNHQSLIIFENEELGSDENNNVLMSSPMKTKNVPLKPCSIRKSQMHWNRMVTSPTLRRSFSESCSMMTAQVSENGLIHHLPCFDSPHDAIKRISPDTLVEVLEGRYGGIYDRLFVIDCRYPYEYEGGHLPSAINVNTPEVIEELLMESPQPNTLIVFHCEFSSERAPRMALHVRNMDRQLNKANYPNLFYPEMYILDGGYKNFWQQHPQRCDPPNAYLPMRNPQFRDQLRHHQKMKHAFKSGFHLSQHSAIKQLPPKAKKTRSKSLNVANARKFFNDLISKPENREEVEEEQSEANLGVKREADVIEDSSFISRPSSVAHMFPSYSIPMANSFSSIFASEIDISSEMDMD